MTDDMLRRSPKNGGVVDVNFFPAFSMRNTAKRQTRSEGQAAAMQKYVESLTARASP